MSHSSLGTRLRAVMAVFVLSAFAGLTGAAQASAGTITGTVFKDTNRNAALDAGEVVMGGQGIYLFDAAGTTRLGYTGTDSSGRYTFSSVADGTYTVRYDDADWWTLRDAWAPSTTPTPRPEQTVTVATTGRADFGWRAIVRSTTLSAPISSYTGPSGLKVMSYDDVVTARTVHDALAAGSLIGSEAAATTVRFDYGTEPNVTNVGVSGGPGSYANFSADVMVRYDSWLDGGDQVLFHEYGHAWSLFHAYTVQQDATLASYLQARGIAGDSRLDTSHAWNRRELIAEDYRQLFGDANARALAQENTELPPAASVPGLRDFLMTTFRTPPAGSGGSGGSGSGGGTTTPPPAPALTVTGLVMNPTTVKTTGTASFTLSAAASVTMIVKDASGKTVRTLLASAAQASGSVSAVWDRKNASGARVKSGTYSVAVDAVDSTGTHATATKSFTVS